MGDHGCDAVCAWCRKPATATRKIGAPVRDIDCFLGRFMFFSLCAAPAVHFTSSCIYTAQGSPRAGEDSAGTKLASWCRGHLLSSSRRC